MYEPLAHHPHHMTHVAASGLASLGRGRDKMLVHMTPEEVGGLQKLALAAGGNLTINPHTGLPEAGFLSSLLPMVAGLGLDVFLPGVGTAIGSALGGLSGAAGTGLLVGAGDAAITGSVKNGLMAGLGAYGGASLGSGIAAQGANAAIQNTSAAGMPDLASAAAKSAYDPANFLNTTTGATDATGMPDLASAAAKSAYNPANFLNTTTGAAGMPDLASAAANYNFANPINLSTTIPTTATAVPSQLADSTNWSNFKTGLSGLTSPTSANPTPFTSLAKSMGPVGMAGVGIPVLQTVSQAMQKNIPSAATTSPEYYNTTYNPLTQKYSTGNWSNQFAGPGFTGAPKAGQTATSAGPMGSYADPYQGIAALLQNPVTAARGGDVRRLASGGDTSSSSDPSALQDYYKGLMSGSATTSTLAKTDPSANNAYMSSISAGSAPSQPVGSTSTTPWINSGYQAAVAANNAANSSGTTSSTTSTPTSSYNVGNISCGGAATPTYSWNPSTQSYTQTGVSGGTGTGVNWNPITQSYIQPTAITGGVSGRGSDKMAQGGGIAALAHGGSPGLGSYSDGGRLLKGPGDGMSDDIPAQIMGKQLQPAALADGEFVIPADVVSHLGNGSTDAGSKKLYQMMDNVRRARTGNPKQGKQINPDKFIPT